jgi:hypothetical protein
MDERQVQLKTILTLYLSEAADSVKELEKRKKNVVESHAVYGPTSTSSNLNLGMFYFMISRNLTTIDKLDSAFKAYIAFLESVIAQKGVTLPEESARMKSMMAQHKASIEEAKKALVQREAHVASLKGQEEKVLLGETALKYTEESNYTLRLNNAMTLYADYVGFLEQNLGITDGFMADEGTASLIKDVILGVEKQFEFEIVKPCPECKKDVKISPQAITLICPFCGGNIA